MKPRARRRVVRALVLTLAFCVALGASPQRAEASSETLKRSIQNLLFAPFDLALAPIVATRSWWSNWNDVDDSPGVHYAYAAPGVVWMLGLQVATSVLREVAGGIELVPGLVLLPFAADTDAIFDLSEENAALVDWEVAGFAIRAGINYTSSSAAY